MDNPETLATQGTQHTGQRQTKQKVQHNATQKIKKISSTYNYDPPKTVGESRCSRRVYKGCRLLVFCQEKKRYNKILILIRLQLLSSIDFSSLKIMILFKEKKRKEKKNPECSGICTK